MTADFLDRLKSTYPKRCGAQVWPAVERQIQRHLADGHDLETMIRGATNYRIHCGRKQIERTEYVMQAKTFFGRDLHWIEWAEMEMRTPAQIAQEARWADLEVRAIRLGFKTVDRARGYDVALRAVEQAEREASRQVVERAGLKLQVVR